MWLNNHARHRAESSFGVSPAAIRVGQTIAQIGYVSGERSAFPLSVALPAWGWIRVPARLFSLLTGPFA